jgi:hypothetical protein
MGGEDDGSGVREFARAATLTDLLGESLMKLVCTLAAIAIVAAGPALAQGKCSSAPKANWQPKSALESQLRADGYKVRQIKTEGGCYEVYATDKGGNRANMAFNAETLEKLDNPEAGEN